MNTWYTIDKVRELDDVAVAELDDLDARCFPFDDLYPKKEPRLYWWVVTEHPTRKVVGFCGSRYMPADRYVFLCRAGVLPEARGKGLQRRMIRTRVAHAKSIDAVGCYSYTSYDNYASANNLIRCGFLLFEPNYAWGGNGAYYLYRDVRSENGK